MSKAARNMEPMSEEKRRVIILSRMAVNRKSQDNER